MPDREAVEFAFALNPSPHKVAMASLVTNLCDSIRDEVVALLPHMPMEWDGHELREYLYERFKRERSRLMTDHRDRYRRRQYLAELARNGHL